MNFVTTLACKSYCRRLGLAAGIFVSLTIPAQALELGEEQIQDNEPAIAQQMITAIKEIGLKRAGDGLVRRFNQPKTVGCVQATFSVPDDLSPELKHGLFANAGAYDATIRFANASKDDDTKKDFRGMSIKLSGVTGDSLYSESGTADFVLNSYPALFAADVEDFYDFIKATRKDRRIGYFANPAHWYSLKIVLAGREKIASPFDINYFSTTPYRLGGEDTAVKYAAKSCSMHTSKRSKKAGPNFLGKAMAEHLKKENVCFDFMVQRQTDAANMPIEDASKTWNESESPFVKVARITIEDQNFLSKKTLKQCEQMSFNPWRTLAEHKPLGGINRVRKTVYEEMAAFRAAQNASK